MDGQALEIMAGGCHIRQFGGFSQAEYTSFQCVQKYSYTVINIVKPTDWTSMGTNYVLENSKRPAGLSRRATMVSTGSTFDGSRNPNNNTVIDLSGLTNACEQVVAAKNQASANLNSAQKDIVATCLGLK